MSEKMATAHVALTNAGELRDSVGAFHWNIARLLSGNSLFTFSRAPRALDMAWEGRLLLLLQRMLQSRRLIDTKEDSHHFGPSVRSLIGAKVEQR
jgi:hypothetical protein